MHIWKIKKWILTENNIRAEGEAMLNELLKTNSTLTKLGIGGGKWKQII